MTVFRSEEYEIEMIWTNLSEHRVREKRARSASALAGMTATRLSLINRAYCHRGRMMLFRLPFKSWRTAAIMGKALRRAREVQP